MANHRLMPSRNLASFAVFAAVLVAVAAVGSNPSPVEAVSNCTVDSEIDAEEEEFLRLINEYRVENGLSPLVLSPSLNLAAAWKSQDMASNGYFAHDDTPAGRSFVDRLRDCGYGFNTWLGENIAAGNDTALEAFEQWRNSPGHDATMLSDNYSAIGIGRAFVLGSPYGWYWTTDFGGTVESSGGDVSCDDTIDPIDAQILLQYLAGFIASMPCGENADVNGDGAVAATDATLILQFSAGLIAGLAL